jgi:hypothetical protein
MRPDLRPTHPHAVSELACDDVQASSKVARARENESQVGAPQVYADKRVVSMGWVHGCQS